MKIDIEAFLTAKREERERKFQAQNDSELERRERRIQRQKDKAELEEKRLREHATFVSACLAEYSPTRLHNWFLLDNWTVQEGLILLCGFDPKNIPLNEQGEIVMPHLWSDELHGKTVVERLALSRIRRLDNLALFDELTVDFLGEDFINAIANDFTFLYQKTVRIWNSGAHTEVRYPPKYFIDWAIKKKIPVDWLEWAQANDYYVDPALIDEKPLGPKERANYLHIIGSLAHLYWESVHSGEKYTQATLIAELENYDFPGMKERNLKEKLTLAMKAIGSHQD